MSCLGRYAGGLFFFLTLFVVPVQARVVPPEPFAASDDYALLVAQDDGYSRLVRVRLKRAEGQCDRGELRSVVSYRYADADGRQRYGTSVSAPLPAGILTGHPAETHFDFSAEPIPPSAHHRVLRVLHQEVSGVAPGVLREYRAEQIRLDSSADSSFLANPSRVGTVVAGPFTFLRERGSPVEESVTFPVVDPNAFYELRLSNGSADGTRRVASAVVTLNGEEVYSPSVFNQHMAGLTRQVTLQAGDNQLKVRLRSAPGTSITLEVVRLDGQPCRIFGPRQYVRTSGKPKVETVVFPLNVESKGPFLLVIGSGDGSGAHRVDSAALTLNGRKILGSGTFNEQVRQIEVPVILQPENILTIELRGKPGDFIDLEITGSDNRPPQISVNQPGDGAVVAGTPIAVSGMIDNSLATVSVNGVQAVVAADGAFVAEGIALREGDNLLSVHAIDPCGNQGEALLHVALRTIPSGPTLTLCAEPFREQTPKPPAEQCGASALENYYGLMVGLVDDTAMSVDIDGVVLPDGVMVSGQGPVGEGMREGNFFWAFVHIPEVDGWHPFTATVTDSAGTTGAASVAFLRDTAAPRLIISTPDDGQVVRDATIEVTGTVDDPNAIVRFG